MPAKLTQPRELFVHKLGVVLKSERNIEKTLPKLQKEAKSPQLSQLFEHHLQETKEHIGNLEQAFEILGEKPKENPSRVAEGLEREHRELRDEVDAALIDFVAAGAGAATEHHEIAAYETLITMAEALGEPEVVHLLEQNFDQERHTLDEIKTISQQLAQRAGVVTA
jgi:ferritin-like metal-binding protein YciE